MWISLKLVLIFIIVPEIIWFKCWVKKIPINGNEKLNLTISLHQ